MSTGGIVALQCEAWLTDAAQFLLGISREAPNCQTSEDVDRLIAKIENYRMDGTKHQDARLNGMDRIVTDLYGESSKPKHDSAVVNGRYACCKT